MAATPDFRATSSFDLSRVDRSGQDVARNVHWRLYAIESLMRVIVHSVLRAELGANWWAITVDLTLQRRLAEAGVHYRALAEEVRFARALQRMEDPSVKLIDVAFELGYSDAAHFTRAFHRWTGVSPRAFRRIHEAEGRAAFPRAASPSN